MSEMIDKMWENPEWHKGSDAAYSEQNQRWKCSCGWFSPIYMHAEFAEAAYDRHYADHKASARLLHRTRIDAALSQSGD